MITKFKITKSLIRSLMTTGLILAVLLPARFWVSAQGGMAYFSVLRSIYTSEFGIVNPAGMAFSPNAKAFFVWGADQSISVITQYEESGGKLRLAQPLENPLGAAFDPHSNSLFILNARNTELSKIEVKQSGLPNSSGQVATNFNISSFDLQDAEGMTFDPATGRLFILDASKSQILIVSPDSVAGFDGASAAQNNRIRRVSLKSLSRAGLRGIAFNPSNKHLYIGNPGERTVYELAETGQVVSTYDVTGLHLENPSTMLFAPSRDTTDDPNIMDLFILDTGQLAAQTNTLMTNQKIAFVTNQKSGSPSGQIIELSLQATTGLPSGTTLLPATLVRTFDTSTWSNPSPDPSGIDYWPAMGKFLISDSEIEESVGGNPPVYWHGYNVFFSTLSGSLAGNCTTFTSDPVGLTYNNFSNEPTGVAINPNNNHIFFSNDGANSRMFELGLGPDGVYCTPDDTVTKISVTSLYGATDAEDVTYANNTLYESDGINAEVYVIPLGADHILSADDGPVT